MQPCRIAAEDLACRRGDRVLFRALGFALGPGDALHVGGANGIGKSSLLRIAAGLLPAFAGMVRRQGAAGLLDERAALDGHRPLYQALGFWAGLDGAATDLDRVGLDRLADVPVGYLSTGQRKRAAFARLLAQRAPIWLLDEPLNGLDTAGTKLAEALIARHRAGGGIVIAASHQPIAMPGAQAIDLAGYAP
ncbi:heme ABC exporter ATP-binding protein CcmA [Parablastomonas sp. CN1-191]|uniref:heme ABC exporter ATP-binding protein CcmA n=1 Tax=Parablastomonas sp. CN1-191 TaxID=3400908 RepID=UPI003BF7DB34